MIFFIFRLCQAQDSDAMRAYGIEWYVIVLIDYFAVLALTEAGIRAIVSVLLQDVVCGHKN